MLEIVERILAALIILALLTLLIILAFPVPNREAVGPTAGKTPATREAENKAKDPAAPPPSAEQPPPPTRKETPPPQQSAEGTPENPPPARTPTGTGRSETTVQGGGGGRTGEGSRSEEHDSGTDTAYDPTEGRPLRPEAGVQRIPRGCVDEKCRARSIRRDCASQGCGFRRIARGCGRTGCGGRVIPKGCVDEGCGVARAPVANSCREAGCGCDDRLRARSRVPVHPYWAERSRRTLEDDEEFELIDDTHAYLARPAGTCPD